MDYTTGNTGHFILQRVPLRESLYDNDDATGVEKSFYPSGKLEEIIHYVSDDRSGSYCLYYDNGKKRRKVITLQISGMVNGMCIVGRARKLKLYGLR